MSLAARTRLFYVLPSWQKGVIAMCRYILCALAVAVVAMGLLGASAQASVIIVTPTAVTASGYYTITPVSNLLSVTNDGVVEPDPTTPSTWYVNSQLGGWMASNALNSNSGPPVVNTVWATFTLAAPTNLGMIDIWNYTQAGNLARSTKVLSVYSCSDVAGDNPTLITATPTVSLAEATNTPEYVNQIPLTNATNVQYVKLAIVQSWAGEAPGAANWVGLGFVTFEGAAAATPEPGTLTLLAAGLAGLLCYAWRKRR